MRKNVVYFVAAWILSVMVVGTPTGSSVGGVAVSTPFEYSRKLGLEVDAGEKVNLFVAGAMTDKSSFHGRVLVTSTSLVSIGGDQGAYGEFAVRAVYNATADAWVAESLIVDEGLLVTPSFGRTHDGSMLTFWIENTTASTRFYTVRVDMLARFAMSFQDYTEIVLN